ncbi:MAG: hypothetical protein GY870_15045 [archaeon]|nr:hypothetical protein [archaeon]
MGKIITKYIWVSVGDAFVCEDCIDRESWSEKTYSEWEGLGLPRGTGTDTRCNGRCRCSLVPSSQVEEFKEGQEKIKKEVEGLIDKFMDEIEIKADLSTGRQIKLKDFEEIGGMLTKPYKTIASMEKKIAKWKEENNYKALPKEFFQISEIDGMTKWLNEKLK